MRFSVPNIPTSVLSNSALREAQSVSSPEAVQRIVSFLSLGNAAVLTGAGVSVDSGVKAYRGKDGRYMNPTYKPIFYQELIEDSPRGHSFRYGYSFQVFYELVILHIARQRYWLRSYIGFLPVRRTIPNPTHDALAALQHAGVVGPLITQNVDGLHHAALRRILSSEPEVDRRILELHGSIFKVNCQHGHVYPRTVFQEWLGEANPGWRAFLAELDRTGAQPKTNPDGDVVLDESVSYDDFVVPHCPSCEAEGRGNSIMKPDFVFFGETIRQDVKDRSIVEGADRLFVIGTTLATYSAFRLLKRALELRKPVLYLNVGPTRADGLPGVDKLEIPTSAVMTEVVHAVV
ncbi:DHS-like NAD/FAD-binding domain-containing protein [Russula vinacea]|nr:DHS-like NAD/FAD-binding domain-containing protein [Russula vinacea]